MAKYDILVMNGPNLGHLGVRQPEIYGSQGMDALHGMTASLMGGCGCDVALTLFQSNSEGGMIDRLEQAWRDKTDGVVLNAGAYTHTSLALADCLAWIKIPTVEVHLSNVWARPETIRHQSHIARQVVGVIAGFGLLSYGLAVQALHRHLEAARCGCQ
ncbi:MAG: type II 3-dehydroquinate dehydratase [Desulfovibrionaceae bacterium]